MYAKPLAYGKQLLVRRKLGERIGLLVVALHDWNAGLEMASRPHVARVMLDEGQMPHECDWSPVLALDCLIAGDEVDDAVFYATATMLYAAGAASIWGEFPDGIWRLERWHSKCCPMGFYAEAGPIAPERFGRALAAHRDCSLLIRAGVYGTKLYDAARAAVFDQAFGPLSAKAQAWVAEKRGFAQGVAA